MNDIVLPHQLGGNIVEDVPMREVHVLREQPFGGSAREIDVEAVDGGGRHRAGDVEEPDGGAAGDVGDHRAVVCCFGERDGGGDVEAKGFFPEVVLEVQAAGGGVGAVEAEVVGFGHVCEARVDNGPVGEFCWGVFKVW